MEETQRVFYSFFIQQMHKIFNTFSENKSFGDNTELQHGIGMRLFHYAEKKWGLHILRCTPNNSYRSPIPKVSELQDKLWEKQYTAGIDWNEEEGLNLINKLAKYSDDYVELINSGKYSQTQGQQFWYHDAAVYYCMIRHFNPKHIIEVGAGGSTRLAYLAIEKTKNNNANATIISIDPFYESKPNELPTLLRMPVQDVPISEFKKLEENDILFIDGSHISKIGSDVNYLILEVLPVLNDGVIVHVHDIYLPDEMPKEWVKSKLEFWNEQYILNAFLIFNSKFKILLSNHYMARFHPDALSKIYNSKPISGGSFWMQKR